MSDNAKILIVDDDHMVHYLIKSILENNNVNLSHAYNGNEAISMTLANDYDLIFMDVRMPILDGIEATKIIKKTFPDLPIITISAFSQSEKDLSIFNGQIQKPLQRERLYAEMKKYI